VDGQGWNLPEHYSTIQCADIDGDGAAELLAKGAAGITAWKYDGAARQWRQLPDGPGWVDGQGWNLPEHYSTIQCADIDGDGKAELLAKGAGGMTFWKYSPDAARWLHLTDGPAWSDDQGWNEESHYATIQCPRLSGFTQAYLIARAATGLTVWQPVPAIPHRWGQVLERADRDVLYRARLANETIQTLAEAGIIFTSKAEAALAAKLVRYTLNAKLPGGPLVPPEYEELMRQRMAGHPPADFGIHASLTPIGFTLTITHDGLKNLIAAGGIVSAIAGVIAAFDFWTADENTTVWEAVGLIPKIAGAFGSAITALAAVFTYLDGRQPVPTGYTFTLWWACVVERLNRRVFRIDDPVMTVV
jgi:hypothetical protein